MTLARTDGASRPTAGALRLVEAGTTSPRSVDVSGYARQMTAHCPYLAPSLERGLTTWTVYRADGDADAVETELFYAGAQAAEWLRPLIHRPGGSFRCENIVVLGDVPGARHRDLMAWPHWVLKNLYGPVGIMFGKFYAGEEESTQTGRRLPIAPVSFLPVRAAVRRRDPQFLHATPDLAAALAVAGDDGRDVFEHLPNEWQEIRTWAKRFLPPGAAVDRLKHHVGEPFETRLLSDRRGSRAWKIHGPKGAVAVKANNPDDDTARDKAAEMAQEDDHLLRLTDAGALSSGYRIDAGSWEGGRWLAVRWVDGVPVWRAFALARGPEGDRQSVRPWLLGIARTWAEHLARMHAAGWAHADVQPTNTLITNDGRAEVIDYALACGPDDGPRLPYRGALTHTTAPEIADAILSTTPDTHIQAEPAADVWGLGASLFWCWTGQRPVAYADDTPRENKLRAIAKAVTIQLDRARPWPFGEFEDAIRACLAPAPQDRPTAKELIAAW